MSQSWPNCINWAKSQSNCNLSNFRNINGRSQSFYVLLLDKRHQTRYRHANSYVKQWWNFNATQMLHRLIHTHTANCTNCLIVNGRSSKIRPLGVHTSADPGHCKVPRGSEQSAESGCILALFAIGYHSTRCSHRECGCRTSDITIWRSDLCEAFSWSVVSSRKSNLCKNLQVW